MVSRVGERFAGRYELIDQLGEGGMASVWRAWDEREGRIVAAKVLRQSDAVSLLRFVREQAVRVASPHVLTPLGWAGEDDRVLFTMPIVDGGSVATLVGDHGPLPPVLAAELLRQLLEALATVHEARLVHRDVKPANLLLAATGGTARTCSSRTSASPSTATGPGSPRPAPSWVRPGSLRRRSSSVASYDRAPTCMRRARSGSSC